MFDPNEDDGLGDLFGTDPAPVVLSISAETDAAIREVLAGHPSPARGAILLDRYQLRLASGLTQPEAEAMLNSARLDVDKTLGTQKRLAEKIAAEAKKATQKSERKPVYYSPIALAPSLASLNARMKGLITGDTLLVYGPTGAGKSTFVWQILTQITEDESIAHLPGLAVAGFVTEFAADLSTSRETGRAADIDVKLACAKAGVRWQEYRNATAEARSSRLDEFVSSPEDVLLVDNTIVAMSEWRKKFLWLSEDPKPKFGQIIDRIIYGPERIVLVDHTAFADSSDQPGKTAQSQFENGIEAMALMAKRHGKLLILVGQAGKQANAAGAAMGLDAIRGSHAVSSVSWYAIGVSRGEMSPDYLPEPLASRLSGKDAGLKRIPGVMNVGIEKSRPGEGEGQRVTLRVEYGSLRDMNPGEAEELALKHGRQLWDDFDLRGDYDSALRNKSQKGAADLDDDLFFLTEDEKQEHLDALHGARVAKAKAKREREKKLAKLGRESREALEKANAAHRQRKAAEA